MNNFNIFSYNYSNNNSNKLTYIRNRFWSNINYYFSCFKKKNEDDDIKLWTHYEVDTNLEEIDQLIDLS
jgi:hypothetical protein